MCLAFPGKIVQLKEKKEGVVDFDGLKRTVRLDLVEVKKGDYVLVHAGFAIQKINKKSALHTISLVRESLKTKGSVVR